MIEIIPAIMPDSFKEVKDKTSEVLGKVNWVQVDVMDGVHVPSISWPYHIEEINTLEDIEIGSVDLPEFDNIKYEVDLMVDDVEKEMARWSKSNASRLIFHIEAIKNPDVLEYVLMNYREEGKREVGVAINIETPLDVIAPILYEVDVVQCMGIAKIGYQKQDFDERVLEQIKGIRKLFPSMTISVDGGVNVDSAPKLIAAGANRLVSGSTIFESKDIALTIENLKKG